MSANLTLFDDLGTLWDGGSPRLRQSFGSPISNDEFSTYVVKNMGFIAVHSYGRSCEIRLRPQLVSPSAFAGLQQWARDRKFERIVVAHYDTDWAYVLFVSKELAFARLDQMLSASRRLRPADYLSRSLSKDELPRSTPMHQAIHSLIENWPLLSQAVHTDGLMNIIKSSLQGRYTLVDASVDGRDLMFREIGDGFMSYNHDWVMRAQGQPVVNMEDAAYGRWAASGYREALRSGQPALSQVDAIMNTPRLGRARVRYSRILLPLKTIAGAMLLTSSILDPTIDLRAELIQKAG